MLSTIQVLCFTLETVLAQAIAHQKTLMHTGLKVSAQPQPLSPKKIMVRLKLSLKREKTTGTCESCLKSILVKTILEIINLTSTNY